MKYLVPMLILILFLPVAALGDQIDIYVGDVQYTPGVTDTYWVQVWIETDYEDTNLTGYKIQADISTAGDGVEWVYNSGDGNVELPVAPHATYILPTGLKFLGTDVEGTNNETLKVQDGTFGADALGDGGVFRAQLEVDASATGCFTIDVNLVSGFTEFRDDVGAPPHQLLTIGNVYSGTISPIPEPSSSVMLLGLLGTVGTAFFVRKRVRRAN